MTPTTRIPVSFAVVALVGLSVAAAYSYFTGGALYQLTHVDPRWVREFFGHFGPWAPAVYMLIVVVEVIVAPIPGVPVYAAGGLALGGWLGGLLGAAANAVGAMMACLLSRSIAVLRWDSTSRLARLVERRGSWMIFALRLNPLTSTDLVSYAAGVTTIPVWKVGLATFFGIAPICFAAAILADELPPLGTFIAGLSITYALLAAAAWFRMSRPCAATETSRERDASST